MILEMDERGYRLGRMLGVHVSLRGAVAKGPIVRLQKIFFIMWRSGVSDPGVCLRVFALRMHFPGVLPELFVGSRHFPAK